MPPPIYNEAGLKLCGVKNAAMATTKVDPKLNELSIAKKAKT